MTSIKTAGAIRVSTLSRTATFHLVCSGLMLLPAGLTCAPEPPCISVDSIQVRPPGSEPLFVGSGDPYQPGLLAVRTIRVARCERGAPVEMEIHAPTAAGRYAVVVFQHGFLADNSLYSEMLKHLAGHGFVVVAPQMYPPGGLPIGKPGTPEETSLAIEVLDWLPGGLSAVSGVEADTGRLGLAGHSRGGKVIWGILLRDPSRALAVAGIDPVDGRGGPFGNEARVTREPFTFSIPSLILGAGLSSQAVSGGMSCAPEGDNHVQFYAASARPAWHVVAPKAGHLDMLNDSIAECGFICAFCKAGPDRTGMRRLSAGLMVALFRGALQGDEAAYEWLTNADAAPIPIEIESK